MDDLVGGWGGVSCLFKKFILRFDAFIFIFFLIAYGLNVEMQLIMYIDLLIYYILCILSCYLSKLPN